MTRRFKIGVGVNVPDDMAEKGVKYIQEYLSTRLFSTSDIDALVLDIMDITKADASQISLDRWGNPK